MGTTKLFPKIGWTILHSHERCVRLPVPPNSLQHSLPDYFLLTIIMSMKWHLIVVRLAFPWWAVMFSIFSYAYWPLACQLFNLFRKSAFYFSCFLYFFLFFILLISNVIFIIFLLLLTLGLVCSSFPSVLRWKIRLLIWDFSSFLIQAFTTINSPISTVLAVPHIFWHVVSWFSFILKYFLFLFF